MTIKVPVNPKFLIIKLRALGDVLLSTPVITTLKKSFPGSEIDFVVLQENYDLVKDNPNLNEVFVLDKKWDKLPFVKRMKKYKELKRKIQSKKYDFMFDLQNSPRSIWVGFFARASMKIGYKKPQNFFYKIRLKQISRMQHNVDDLLYLLNPISPTQISRHLNINIPDEIVDTLKQKFNPDGSEYVIIHPGAGRRRRFKMWGIENFVKVARAVIDLGYRVFIIGGPGDSDLIQEFKTQLSETPKLTYLDNKFNITELGGFIKNAKLFIGNDSGPIHIADALNIPSIGIFGASSPVRWGVIKPPHINLFKEIGCNPCDKVNCIYNSPKCLEAITPDDVIEKLKYFL